MDKIKDLYKLNWNLKKKNHFYNFIWFLIYWERNQSIINKTILLNLKLPFLSNMVIVLIDFKILLIYLCKMNFFF